jgi:hypothetical protein
MRRSRVMPRPISPRLHGILDYTTSAAVAATPRLLGFPPTARRMFDTLAGGYTGISAFTNYPLSVKRAIPFKAHGAAELAMAAALPAMPWVLGFANHKAARNLCFGLTVLTIVVAALTDWSADD